MFELEKTCVPIPRQKYGVSGQPLYPFAQMEVGGPPFCAPRDMGKTASGGDIRQNSIVGSARYWAKRHCPDAKFITRTIDENTVGCWRVK